MTTGTYVVHPVRVGNELRTDCLPAYLDSKKDRLNGVIVNNDYNVVSSFLKMGLYLSLSHLDNYVLVNVSSIANKFSS